MRDINEVAKKMARNGLKIAKSLDCAFHFESEFTRRFYGYPLIKTSSLVHTQQLVQSRN